MKTEEIFPRFYKEKGSDLIAILKKDRMFHLKAGQWGKGDGFEFRIYVTRTMVLKYGKGTEISFEEFQKSLSTVFVKYLTEINDLLPKGYLESKNNKLMLE